MFYNGKTFQDLQNGEHNTLRQNQLLNLPSDRISNIYSYLLEEIIIKLLLV